GRLQDRAVVLQRGLCRPPLDRPGDGVGFALQGRRHHPVDGGQEQDREHAEQHEARRVAPPRPVLAALHARPHRRGGPRRRPCRHGRRPVGGGPGAHALPLPRSRNVRRNWKPVTTSSSAPKSSDIAAAELNWKRVNASSVTNIITLCVVLNGPPAVITCGCPNSWNEAIVVVTAAKSVTGFSCGQVT